MNISSRQELTRALSEPETAFVYQFGCDRTRGFGADYLGFLNRLMTCLRFGIGFRFGTVARPRGFIVQHGWSDYFLPFCGEVDAPLIQLLNVSQFPYARKIPITRSLAGAWLRLLSQPRADYFMFDGLPELGVLGPPIFSDNENFLSARQHLISILWVYNSETGEAVDALQQSVDLPKTYAAICIRRGDKAIEFPYVEIERYAERIFAVAGAGIPIFIATDDVGILPRCREVLNECQLVALSDQDMTGYDHALFKALPAAERKRRTIRFFAQLEFLRAATLFFGSKTTNVAWLTNAHRGGEGVFWVD
jgi:hypothetical protein